MTQVAANQQRIEEAAEHVAAKLLAFHEDLTSDERRALYAILHETGCAMEATADDVAGYQKVIKPSLVECVIWQEQVRSFVELITLGYVKDFTPDCSYMPLPSQPA